MGVSTPSPMHDRLTVEPGLVRCRWAGPSSKKQRSSWEVPWRIWGKSKIPEILPRSPRPRIFWKGQCWVSSRAPGRTGKCGERGCQHLGFGTRYCVVQGKVFQ